FFCAPATTEIYSLSLHDALPICAFIAMVIAQDTEYILLDEPLNNLDMKHSVQIMKILRRLVNELGKTVIIVLHDINFASVYSDRIVALKDGKVVKDGPT